MQSGLGFAVRSLYKEFSVILKELKELDLEYIKRYKLMFDERFAFQEYALWEQNRQS